MKGTASVCCRNPQLNAVDTEDHWITAAFQAERLQRNSLGFCFDILQATVTETEPLSLLSLCACNNESPAEGSGSLLRNSPGWILWRRKGEPMFQCSVCALFVFQTGKNESLAKRDLVSYLHKDSLQSLMKWMINSLWFRYVVSFSGNSYTRDSKFAIALYCFCDRRKSIFVTSKQPAEKHLHQRVYLRTVKLSDVSYDRTGTRANDTNSRWNYQLLSITSW